MAWLLGEAWETRPEVTAPKTHSAHTHTHTRAHSRPHAQVTESYNTPRRQVGSDWQRLCVRCGAGAGVRRQLSEGGGEGGSPDEGRGGGATQGTRREAGCAACATGALRRATECWPRAGRRQARWQWPGVGQRSVSKRSAATGRYYVLDAKCLRSAEVDGRHQRLSGVSQSCHCHSPLHSR